MTTRKLTAPQQALLDRVRATGEVRQQTGGMQ